MTGHQAAVRQAVDAHRLVEHCEAHGYELERADTVFVVTIRDGSSVRVIGGSAADVLAKITPGQTS